MNKTPEKTQDFLPLEDNDSARTIFKHRTVSNLLRMYFSTRFTKENFTKMKQGRSDTFRFEFKEVLEHANKLFSLVGFEPLTKEDEGYALEACFGSTFRFSEPDKVLDLNSKDIAKYMKKIRAIRVYSFLEKSMIDGGTSN